MAQSTVRREFKFSVLVPAAQYYPVAADAPEEKVLLQGVIDCLIDTPEGYVILDFKTDRVSRSRALPRAPNSTARSSRRMRWLCGRYSAARLKKASCIFSTPEVCGNGGVKIALKNAAGG